jgi:small acid-soluble spore protein D (minor alpha/beta-type SASP)
MVWRWLFMSKRPLVPECKNELDKFKIESANEIGIELNNKYNGNVSSKANGAVGGRIGGLMTKHMVEEFEKGLIDKNI